MKRSTLLFYLALSITSTTSLAKTEKIQESTLPNGLKVQEYRLDNGMQLLLVPDSSAPVFTYQVWFKVGSATEKLDPKLNKTGLAHLFEHMMFRGTPKNPDQIFDAKISAAGAVGNNATTWLDRTNYFESLPKERLELIFSLESDRMVNLALNEQLFKTELGAVIGEYKMNEDKPMRVGYRMLWSLAFEKHPYKWTTMGTLDELNSFKVEDAQYFYKTYYAPNNATLILIGDFSTKKAIQLAEKYYGKIPSQAIPERTPPVEPEQKEARSVKGTHHLLNSDILLMAYHTPSIQNADMAALEVLAATLAYGDGSALERKLVQSGVSSSAFASSYKLKYPSLFVIGTQLAPEKNSSDAMKIIQKEIEKIQADGLDSSELDRAKNQFLLFSYNELLNQGPIGEALGESLMSADSYLRGFEILEQVKKVTSEDVKRVANTYLKEEKSNTVVLQPGKGK